MISGGHNSTITAQTQTKIDQLKNEKCGTDQQCLQKVETLVGEIHQLCDAEPRNVQDNYKQTCLSRQLTDPNVTPIRKFLFENNGNTFLGHYGALPRPQAGGQTDAGGGAPAGSAGAGAAGGTGGQQVGGTAAVGTVPPVASAEYDSDGYRKISSLVSEKEEGVPPTPVQGSGRIQVDTFKEALISPSFNLVVPVTSLSGPSATVEMEAGINVLHANTVSHEKPIALLKGEHPSGLVVLDFTLLPVKVTLPLGGKIAISLPDINLIQQNASAAKLESTLRKRWGWDKESDKEKAAKWGVRAANIYLESVLRPTMAYAGSTEPEFNVAWNVAVTQGTAFYDKFLNSSELPQPDQANLVAEIFKHDPMGLVDAIALWAGKKPEEVKKALEGSGDLNAFQANKAEQRTENFSKVLAAAKGLGLSRAYEVPSESQKTIDPSVVSVPLYLDRTEGYAYAMENHMSQIAKAAGLTEEELNNFIKEYKTDPFSLRLDNDPGNVWAAQRKWNDFAKALLEKLVPEKDKTEWFLIIKGGYQDYGADNPGLGVSAGLEYKPGDFTVGASAYGGYSRSNWIETDPETGTAFIGADGTAVGVKGNAAWVFYKSKEGVWREAKVEGGISYATAGSEAAPGKSQDVVVPEVNVQAKAHILIPWTLKGTFAYRERWPNDGSPSNFRKIYQGDLTAQVTSTVAWKNVVAYRSGAPFGDQTIVGVEEPIFGHTTTGGRPDLEFVIGEDAWLIRSALEYRFNERFAIDAGVWLIRSASHYSPEVYDWFKYLTVGLSVNF